MLQTYLSPRSFIRGTKYVVLNLTLTLILLVSADAVFADRYSTQQNLQKIVAAAIAHEASGAIASNKWTRIEFSKSYTDPIVVVDPSLAHKNGAFMVGIRNVSSTGFEISLKSCKQALDSPLQENVNFSIIENSELSTAQVNSPIRQVYAWGKCPA